LRQAREFMSEASGPPESEAEERRLTNTLHALDNASRLAEVASEKDGFGQAAAGPQEARAVQLCVEAMGHAATIADELGALPDGSAPAASDGAPIQQALVQLGNCATTLGELQSAHRRATLSSVAGGAVSADEAIARVDRVRRLDEIAHHAWRSAAHLLEAGA